MTKLETKKDYVDYGKKLKKNSAAQPNKEKRKNENPHKSKKEIVAIPNQTLNSKSNPKTGGGK